jgi:hypothetical protein
LSFVSRRPSPFSGRGLTLTRLDSCSEVCLDRTIGGYRFPPPLASFDTCLDPRVFSIRSGSCCLCPAGFLSSGCLPPQSAIPESRRPGMPDGATRTQDSSSGFFPYSTQKRLEPALPRQSIAWHAPPAGFSHPLGDFPAPRAARPCFMPMALMGFPARSRTGGVVVKRNHTDTCANAPLQGSLFSRCDWVRPQPPLMSLPPSGSPSRALLRVGTLQSLDSERPGICLRRDRRPS